MRPITDRLLFTRFIRAAIGAGCGTLMLACSASAENAKPATPAPAPAAAHAPSGPPLTGFWQAYNDDERPGGVFYFYEKNGLWEGRLVKAIKYPDEPAEEPLCVHCPAEKKNTPMMGLVIVWGMKRVSPTKYEDGHILDPRNGSIYNAQLEVTPDDKKLNLRGYLGFSMLGQTRVWTRLPDDTMALADIPGEPLPGLAAAPVKKPAAHPPAPAGAAPAAAKPAPAGKSP
jgi:hypothetical protein